MKLQDFITETLLQISAGVKNANNKLEYNQLQISPYIVERLSGLNENSYFIGFAEGKRIVQTVNFDISVIVECETNKGAEIKVAQKNIEVGLFGKKKIVEQNISKIKFSIPISFPNCIEK